ncbi:hypothetical protein CMV_008787 [Castanea mollissima]|uniref:XS domain-containing protein n=1 Tax=Castanea mollissima TaxID=60419 RepID=A0A8J4R805_9ROSI|nr:hypothetical protein CMV_008787 [Castanea mollissima]
MAGVNPNKNAPHKPPSSSSAAAAAAASSSSHRKSRWENNPSATANTTTPSKPNPSPKPGDSKPNPSPKPAPTPSPANQRHHQHQHHHHQAHPTPPRLWRRRLSQISLLNNLEPYFPSCLRYIQVVSETRQSVTSFDTLDDVHVFWVVTSVLLCGDPFVLADGTVRSYFALPPDYQDFNPMPPPMPMLPPHRLPGSPGGGGGFNRHQQDYWNSLGLDGRGPGPGGPSMEGPSSLKRKYMNEEEEKHRQQFGIGNGFPIGNEFLAGNSGPFGRSGGGGGGDEYSNNRASKYIRLGGGGGNENNVLHKHLQVDQSALNKAFLQFAKLLNELSNQKKTYLEDGKLGRLPCLACGRSTKEFPDVHSLIMHTYHSDHGDLHVDHLGLHKALCILMGWNYLKPPDNSKTYQFLSADEAAMNQYDLIMWPPMVIIHNTITGKGKEGRMEGLGNKAMDSKIRELGFGGGKSRSLYGREGHLGTTLVKFSGDQSGLKEALQMAEFFEKENHGRKAWARVQPSHFSRDDEKNPNLVKVDEKTGEKKRIFYGYLGTASDMEKFDFDTKKKVTIESLREYLSK